MQCRAIFLRFFVIVVFFAAGNKFSFGQTPHLPNSYTSSANNSIRTWDATRPGLDVTSISAMQPLRDVKQATQYFDGLGRPLQTVVKEGSFPTGGSAVDMISTVHYDALGREQFKYLSTPANNTGGNTSITDGKFKLNPFAQQAAFYNSSNTSSPVYSQGETFFYSQTKFEPSPLNRVSEAAAPGLSWTGTMWKAAESDRRSVKMKYYVNTSNDVVRILTANIGSPGSFSTYTIGATYAAGLLYKAISVDEHGKQVIEFKDKEGKIILKKVQLSTANGTEDDGTGRNHSGWLCTYYVYDDFNLLRCVIQPQGVSLLDGAGWTPAMLTTILPEQCFRYEYDERKRMIVKKVPGADHVLMVYDKRDRLVMVQDAKMRIAPAKWMVTKYDELNRPIETGLWTNATAFATHRTNALTTYPYPATPSGYEELTKTFYDNYDWLASNGNPFSENRNNWHDDHLLTPSNSNYPYPQALTQSFATKGMVTGTKIKVLGTGQFLYGINYYDDKGRVIQTINHNITGFTDVVTTQYNFTGQPLIQTIRSDKDFATDRVEFVRTAFEYDDLGRILNVKKTPYTFLDGTWKGGIQNQIVQNEYDALGQLKKKKLAPAYNANAGLETLTYDYNIRGWMLGMNRDYLITEGQTSDGRYFGFELGYDKLTNKSSRNFTGTGEFNGNIGGMIWKTDGDDIRRKYDFRYDPVNRLLKADFEQHNANDHAWNNSQVNYSAKMGDGTDANTAYDYNGNIKTMTQFGWKLGAVSTIPVDNMRYTYVANSNRLKSVKDFNNDVLTKLGDFKTNTTHPQSATKTALTTSSTQAQFDAITDYAYDVNGNLTTDNNKSISSITYNHLNLPSVITVAGKGTIAYTYDAAGNKLKKVTTETNATVPFNGTNYTSNIITTTTYLGAGVYESKDYVNTSLNGLDISEQLQFIGHEEGRIRFKPENNAFNFDYFLKDHLGNVRMVLTEETQLDIYPVATLEGPIPNATTTATSLVYKEKDYYTIDNNFIVANPAGINISPNTVYQNNNLGTNNNPNCTGTLCTTTASANVYRLNANTNKTGLGITLKVMAGDKVNVASKSYHKPAPGTTYTDPVALLALVDILNAFTGSGIMSSKGITGTQLNSYNTNPPNPTSFFNGQPTQTTNLPQAFINYILFDEQFKYAGSGFVQVGASGVLTDHVIPNIPITKNGYIFVYCSNESKYDVFFDNLHVTHNRGRILEETHYYPFGLTMAGISSKALKSNYAENKRKYNDGTELNTDFDLNWYETNFRSLDPQIGRFHQIDPFAEASDSWTPYAYANDNPILFNDPTGLISDSTVKPVPPPCADCPTGKMAEVKELEPVVVTASKKSSSSYKWYEFFNDHNPGGDFLYELNRWNPIANVFNGVKTYATGSDFYDVEQSNETATVQIISVIPIGRLSSTVSNVSLAAIRQGIAKTLANPNSISHILASKHNLNLLLSKAGSEANIIRKLYLSLGQSGALPAAGKFEINVAIYGNNVTVRGAVVDGIPRIGTAFIP